MKQKIKLRDLITIVCCFFFLPNTHAQKKWVRLENNEEHSNSEDVFSNSKYFRLENNNEMVKYKEHVDEYDNKHVKYAQTYKGIQVEKGLYILHYSKGALSSMNGEVVSGIHIDNFNFIPEESAIEKVLVDLEKKGKSILNFKVKKPNGAVLNERNKDLRGSLIIKEKSDKLGKEFVPCYEFILSLDDEHESYKCWVDAVSGEIFEIRSNARNCDLGTGTGTTRYNGSQTFKTKWTGSIGRYKLKDDCRKIYTYDYDSGSPNEYKDWNNVWSNSNDQEGITVHWGLQRAFDFYEFAYNLTGVDGFYQSINAFTEWNVLLSNAKWDDDEIYVRGQSSSINSYATLDVLGHEWTHGVDEYSANLEYEDESGALDESFADIFGAMVEYYVEGAHAGNYLQGDDRGASRSLINPGAFGHPSIYEGANWHDFNVDPSDNGGVHTNSGVQNHWFYLLAEGGSQIVSGTTHTVTAIGIEDAAYVAYKNRRDYLTQFSDYADSKNGSIMAAIDIWGECDWRVEQVINAWNAVGVSSVTGIQFNEAVNCGTVTSTHGLGLTYNHRVINNLTSNCVYAPANVTDLRAGNEIRLTPGTVASGNFRAHIIPCFTNNLKGSPYPTNYGGIGNTTVELEESEIDIEPFLEELDMNIYPNPTNGKFTIELINFSENESIEVTDLIGTSIYSKTMQDKRTVVDLSNQPNGVYLVKLISNDKAVTKKIIKQ